MPDQPLQPFGSPTLLFNQLHITPDFAIQLVLYAVFFFWTIYTLVAIYHWLKYSHASLIAFPAIALHILVSLSLIVYIFSYPVIT